jgi:hypothetical protein
LLLLRSELKHQGVCDYLLAWLNARNFSPLGDFVQAGPQEVELEKPADVHARLQMQGRIVKHEDGNPLDFLLSDLGPIKAHLGCIAKGAPVARKKRQKGTDENYG